MPRVIRCPNCRAPLDPGDEKRIVCRYCGVTSELDARRTLHPIAGMPAHRPGGSGKATLKVLLPGLLALGAVGNRQAEQALLGLRGKGNDAYREVVAQALDEIRRRRYA